MQAREAAVTVITDPTKLLMRNDRLVYTGLRPHYEEDQAVRTAFFCIALTILAFAFVAETSAQSLADNEHYSDFKRWVIAAQSKKPDTRIYDFCLEAYDKLIASGVSPSARVPEQVISEDFEFKAVEFKGTVKEVKDKYCSSGKDKLVGDLTAKFAPYKAVLKADKLRLVVDERQGVVFRYALTGGKYTDDPKALAAARVWFLDIGRSTAETRYCLNGGKLGSVRRYTFDANHKLLGTTEKEYCGTPPASAYR